MPRPTPGDDPLIQQPLLLVMPAKLELVPTDYLESADAAGEDAFPIWIPP